MSIGSREYNLKPTPRALMWESILSLSFPTVKFMLVDGVGLRPMGPDLDLLLWCCSLIFFSKTVKTTTWLATSSPWFKKIWSGSSRTGNPKGAIFGNRWEATTSSGTECPMSIPSSSARACLTNLETAPMLQDAAQLEAVFRPLSTDTGLAASWRNLITDPEIQLSFMLSHLLKLTQSLTTKLPKPSRNLLKLSAQSMPSTNKKSKAESREFLWEDTPVIVMQVEILGSCLLQFWLKLSIRVLWHWWKVTVSKRSRTGLHGSIFSSFPLMHLSISRSKLPLEPVMQWCIDFISTSRETAVTLLSRLIEIMEYRNLLMIWHGAMPIF